MKLTLSEFREIYDVIKKCPDKNELTKKGCIKNGHVAIMCCDCALEQAREKGWIEKTAEEELDKYHKQLINTYWPAEEHTHYNKLYELAKKANQETKESK